MPGIGGAARHRRGHDLRHTASTLAALAGATVRELMDRAGHTPPRMALRYQHVAASRGQEIPDRMAELMAPRDDRGMEPRRSEE